MVMEEGTAGNRSVVVLCLETQRTSKCLSGGGAVEELSALSSLAMEGEGVHDTDLTDDATRSRGVPSCRCLAAWKWRWLVLSRCRVEKAEALAAALLRRGGGAGVCCSPAWAARDAWFRTSRIWRGALIFLRSGSCSALYRAQPI